ncbi:hypothetical protein Rsub_07695 [Raphidocelis subcapitata]|uniref:Uncharacterized protein n=1 Tax=Raphidocelis subcapitata TaxID=307507 RepID=A0A2V0P5F3_9CHLO|nr:hypothetical protein Rsub_07695 [Raphidocelis subcapitata]|eukprot:GBF95111.1 hypothetical protein Rsub_07695 [Raphidocelis subcapitata]
MSVKRPEAYPSYAPVDAAGFAGAQDLEGGSGFGAKEYQFLRAGFVRKVFGLLAAQLALTAAVAAPIVLSSGVRGFVATNSWVVSLASLGSLVLVLVLSLSESARHSHPTNLILLAAFTALEGVLVGAISATYSLSSVALAVALTAGVAGSLAVYAHRAKTDYTARGGALLSALVSLLLTGLFGALFGGGRGLELLLAGGGAVLFSFYIVYDVQLIIGGAHAKFQLSPDDYVAGTLALYLDVINLFIHLLRLLGNERE